MARDTPPEAPGRILPLTTKQNPGTFWGRGEAQNFSHDHSSSYRGSQTFSETAS